jgi:hypothetical protein
VPVEYTLLSPAYAFVRDTLGWAFRRLRRSDPSEVIRARQHWKNEIEGKLHWIDDKVGFGEAIIRDARRFDAYPNVDDRKRGISAWFRVGILGLYHKGLQVGLRIEALKYDITYGRWRLNDFKIGETKDMNAYLVGKIPFERVVSIDWDGDEFYGFPHVYCHFSSRKREPYEEVVFCGTRDA